MLANVQKSWKTSKVGLASCYKTASAKGKLLFSADVHFAVGQIGNPDDFEEFTDSTNPKNKRPMKKTKRLYRDNKNRILGGVCGGLGAYLNIDPVLIRVAFVISVAFLGTGTLVYIILWAIIPPAQTSAQRLEMSGKEVNLDNIEDVINQEFNKKKR